MKKNHNPNKRIDIITKPNIFLFPMYLHDEKHSRFNNFLVPPKTLNYKNLLSQNKLFWHFKSKKILLFENLIYF